VLDCVAWREVFFTYGEADFFKGFAAGGLPGGFLEGVGFAAWEGCLAGIWEGDRLEDILRWSLVVRGVWWSYSSLVWRCGS
jgi:hypothetical protein